MKYTVEKKEEKVLVSFEIDANEWEVAIEEAYNKTKSKYNMQGFRKGHVPRRVIEGVYGKGIFIEDAFNGSFSKWYFDMLEKEASIYPVDRPEVDVGDINENGVKFTTLIVVKPEVVLGQYKDLTVAREEAKVSEDEINEELNKVLERNSRMVSVTDRAVANGDILTLDYSGAVAGVKFEGGTAEQQTLEIGSNTFIPGFEPQLVGMNIGETKDITVKFPDDYQASDLKGKDAIFTVTVHEIKVKELPILDDEFAKDVSEFNSLNEYKADIKAKLTEQAQKKSEQIYENKLVEAISANVKLDIPQAMIETQIDNFVQEFEYTLMYQGLKIDDYLKYTNQTREDMRKQYAERSAKAVKSRLVMEEIIKAENLKADETKVEEKIVEYAAQSNVSVEEFKKTLDGQQMDYLRNEVVTATLIEYLKSVNKSVDKKAKK